MQVSVENTSGLERRMTVAVPAERIESEVEARLKSLAQRAKVHGFRQGKVPMAVIRQQFGGDVRQEVLGKVLQSSFYEAVTQQKLRPAGGPAIEPTQMEPGKELRYTAVFEVYPEVSIGDLGALSIKRPSAEITEEDVDRVIENLRRQRIVWNKVDRPAQKADRLTIHFRGTIDGVAFKGGEGKDVGIELGAGRFIPGFEDHLVGAKAGDKPDFEVQFPADYFAKDLAGKNARFEVEVVSVAEPVLPPVDEALAKGYGVDGGVDALRADVRGNMQRELDQAIKARAKERVLDALLAANPVDVPKALVQQEVESLAEQAATQTFGGKAKAADLPRELFAEQAERRVKLALLINELIRSSGISLDRDRVRKSVETVASAYENPDQVVQWYYGDRNRLAQVEAAVLEDQVIESILAKARVEEESLSFDALMNRN